MIKDLNVKPETVKQEKDPWYLSWQQFFYMTLMPKQQKQK